MTTKWILAQASVREKKILLHAMTHDKEMPDLFCKNYKEDLWMISNLVTNGKHVELDKIYVLEVPCLMAKVLTLETGIHTALAISTGACSNRGSICFD